MASKYTFSRLLTTSLHSPHLPPICAPSLPPSAFHCTTDFPTERSFLTLSHLLFPFLRCHCSKRLQLCPPLPLCHSLLLSGSAAASKHRTPGSRTGSPLGELTWCSSLLGTPFLCLRLGSCSSPHPLSVVTAEISCFLPPCTCSL